MVNDTELMLTISLANVLILSDDSLTPWTDVSLVGVPGVSTYNNNQKLPPAILAPSSLRLFIDTMKSMNLPFKYDYAVSVMK